MTRGTIKAWYLVHKWSGLIPTVFLLMLCITGLPLIFHDEIDAAMEDGTSSALAGTPSAEGGLPLDAMLAKCGEGVTYVIALEVPDEASARSGVAPGRAPAGDPLDAARSLARGHSATAPSGLAAKGRMGSHCQAVLPRTIERTRVRTRASARERYSQRRRMARANQSTHAEPRA